MNASPGALRALAHHLEAVTKTVRSHGGHGWTYDDEIHQLNTAADRLQLLESEESRRIARLAAAIPANPNARGLSNPG